MLKKIDRDISAQFLLVNIETGCVVVDSALKVSSKVGLTSLISVQLYLCIINFVLSPINPLNGCMVLCVVFNDFTLVQKQKT